MGQSRRQRPARLAAKLREIRIKLDWTQKQMTKRLRKIKAGLQPGHVSEYETGKREPSLLMLLEYARIAGIPMEVLIDDNLDLPKHLPILPEQYILVMKRVRTSPRNH